MVLAISVVLVALGGLLAMTGEAPKAGTASVQTLGLGLMLVGLTVLVATLTARGTARRENEAASAAVTPARSGRAP